jgi:hypothetical protein
MASSDPDSRVPRRERPSFATTFLRLYHGDGLFRSSNDFAVIGLAVYMFVAPLPVPSFDWLTHTGTGNPGSQVAGKAAPAVTPPTVPPNIAQAANPNSGKPNPLDEKIKRQWFKFSDPEIVPALHRAADDVTKGSFAAARTLLDAIGRPDDPNVLHLTAIAHAVSHEKDWKKHAFDTHMRAALAGHPETMDEIGQYLCLGEAGAIDERGARMVREGDRGGQRLSGDQSGSSLLQWLGAARRSREGCPILQAGGGTRRRVGNA